MRFLAVPKAEAERARRWLNRCRRIAPDVLVIQEAGSILFPLDPEPRPGENGTLEPGEGVHPEPGKNGHLEPGKNGHLQSGPPDTTWVEVERAGKRKPVPRNPFRRVCKRLPEHADRLAYRWDTLGDAIILKLPNDLHQPEVGRAYAEEIPASTVYAEIAGPRGPDRRPHLVRLWGPGGEVAHLENRFLYHLDPEEVMFSSGNVGERTRAEGFPQEGEVIVEMGGGIGYFVLPMARAGKATRIHAWERNPVAAGWLVKNLEINRLTDQVEVHIEDVMEAPEGIADRVVQPIFEDSLTLAGKALRILKAGGGTLHWHRRIDVWELEENLRRDIAEVIAHDGRGWVIHEQAWHRVKTFGPGRSHMVMDLRIGPPVHD